MKLHTAVNQYIAYRTSLGEKFRTNGYFLRAFVCAVGLNKNLSDIQIEQVNKFLAGAGTITATWHCKYTALHGFYSYVLSRGYIKTLPLPNVIPKRPEAIKPYIYRVEELSALLDACLSYPGHQLDPYMIKTFLLLLYGAGLRRSEAINLTLADVDLSQLLITVRETKFYKSRLVPIGRQLTKALSQYALYRHKKGHSLNPEAPFFIGRNGKSIHKNSLEYAFNLIRKKAGIRRTDTARFQPRLHDLRHTFAVHRLIAWYKQRADVQQWLPVLSQYLGHSRVSSTSVYLTMTPALLDEASHRFEDYAFKGGIS